MRIILLRGLGRDQLHWRPLLRVIKQLIPGVSIETPDLPGAGVLHKTPSPVNLKQYLPHLEQQLSDSREPAVLMGLSLGGMIALKWAESRPDWFSHVFAVNSSSRESFFMRRLLVYKAVRYPGIFNRRQIPVKERATYHLTCNSRPMPTETLDHWVEVQQRHPVKLTNQIRQVLAALRYQLPSPRAIKNVSVVYSEGDRLVSPSCSIAMARYFRIDPIVHPWAGHDLPQDDPEFIANLLKASLDQRQH